LKEQLGLDDVSLNVALRSLAKAGYLEVISSAAGVIAVRDVTERTRRELDAWPSASGMLEQLVAELLAQADAETEPERKNKLRAAAEILGGVARDPAVAAISKQLG
jgi:hypothetical protein